MSGRRSARRGVVVAAALALALLAVYGLWLRDSPLVAVERVEVTGLTGPDAPELEARIVRRARTMTTLNVRTDPLEEAIAEHPALRRIEASPSLPHDLEVRVVEHRPVARLRAGRRDGPVVAADGTLLRGLRVGRPLAEVGVTDIPPRSERRVRERRARRLVRALAAAPGPLGRRLERVREEPGRGLVLRLRDGPDLVLGDLGRLAAKWTAAARVLADPASRGAGYVDVRMPDRPVSGGGGREVAPPDATKAGEGPAGPASEPAEESPATATGSAPTLDR